MAKKTALVQPPPAKPDRVELLAMLLKQIGNDRAYTVITEGANLYVIHFAGDDKPKTFTFSDGKWKVK
jgi:hypothetical protein